MNPAARYLSWLVAGAALLLLVPLPETGRVGYSLQDLAHVPIAGLLALVAYGLLRRVRSLPRFVAALAALVAASVFLAAVEVVQPLFGRGRSLQDLVTGVLAAAGTLSAIVTWSKGGVARAVGILTGGVLIAFACLPAGEVLYDAWRQRRDVPMLASFEDDLEMSRWWFCHADAARVQDHATYGSWSLRIDLHAGTYPGATLAWPVPDWGGWRALAFDVHVDGEETLDLILKVVDADHDGSYEDRFHEEMHLESGAHRIRIPLERIATGPSTRTLDLGRVAAVQLFVDGLEGPRTIHLDGLRLLGAGR